ncbi:MAG: CpsD/CapB family tyrosine-protein kinase [Pirellulaceae bacterium]|nr:CpsD/CapB family tyrosine-protein kinase [Pirellulaceae bacterium]
MITNSSNTATCDLSPRQAPGTLAVPISECQHYYHTLLRSLPLRSNGANHPIATLGITSCYSGEGVSTVAVQLSLAAASTGLRVLLVDLNWKRPSVHKAFNVPPSPGLIDALASDGSMEVSVQASHILNLYLLPAGSSQEDFNQTTSLEKIAELIRSLRVDYDLIVFDLLASADAGTSLSLGSLLDGVVLVVESERVRWEVASRVQDLLSRSGAKVLGAVLNKQRQHIPNWLYRTL